MKVKMVLAALALGVAANGSAQAEELVCSEVAPIPVAYGLGDDDAPTRRAGPEADSGSDEDNQDKDDDLAVDPCGTITVAPFDILDGPAEAPKTV